MLQNIRFVPILWVCGHLDASGESMCGQKVCDGSTVVLICHYRTKGINADKMLTVALKRYSEQQQIYLGRLDLESALSLKITLPFNNIIVSLDMAKA